MAADAHQQNPKTPSTPPAQPLHDCKSRQSSPDGLIGVLEFAALAPGSEPQMQRIRHDFPDSAQRPEARLSSLVRAVQSSVGTMNTYQSSRIADGCSEAPTDGVIHPRGQGDEGDWRINAYIAGRHSQKSSHATSAGGRDTAAEASLVKMERGERTSTSGRWPSRSGHGRVPLIAEPLSRRRGLVLLALEAAGGVLMTQWRWCRPDDLPMGHFADSSQRVIPNTTTWGSSPEVASLLDHPGALLLGIMSSFASLAVRYHQTRVEKQDLVLIATVGSAVVMSRLLGLDAPTILLRVAPWAAMLGFWINTYRGSGRKSSVR